MKDDLHFATLPGLGVSYGPVYQQFQQMEQQVAQMLGELTPGREGSAAFHARLRTAARLQMTAVGMPFMSRATGVAEPLASRGDYSSGVIDAALRKVTDAHVAALRDAGLSGEVLEVLQSLLDVTVETRLLQRELEIGRAALPVGRDGGKSAPSPTGRDPAAPLSAAELGQALGGLSDETVRLRERAGELFSILRPGRKRGREYPAFQAWPGISGDPLAMLLQVLGRPNGTVAYGFFTSRSDLLAGLTPVEVLLGDTADSSRAADDDALRLLQAKAAARFEAVKSAAEAHAALQSA
jgi:hypothetical protein